MAKTTEKRWMLGKDELIADVTANGKLINVRIVFEGIGTFSVKDPRNVKYLEERLRAVGVLEV